jgi:hypothetical protein
LELAIIRSDNLTSHIIPMGYFFWCSHLKQTIHIAHSVFHFPTKLSSVLQAHWYPTCVLELPFRSRRTNNTDGSTLILISEFIWWLYTANYRFLQHRSVIMDNLKFLRTFWGFPHLFYKGKWFFSEVKHFCNFFLFFFKKRKTIQRFTTPVNLFLNCLTKVSKLILIVKLFLIFFSGFGIDDIRPIFM